MLGSAEAFLIRLQLAAPNQQIIGPELYNQIFTMHGLTMIFLAVMPLGTAFANYFVPLMIGARDLAFPRLNAFGYWAYLAGGLILVLELPLRRRTRRGLVRLRADDPTGVHAGHRHRLLHHGSC